MSLYSNGTFPVRLILIFDAAGELLLRSFHEQHTVAGIKIGIKEHVPIAAIPACVKKKPTLRKLEGVIVHQLLINQKTIILKISALCRVEFSLILRAL